MRFWSLALPPPLHTRVVVTCERCDLPTVKQTFPHARSVMRLTEQAAHVLTCSCPSAQPCKEWLLYATSLGCYICCGALYAGIAKITAMQEQESQRRDD